MGKKANKTAKIPSITNVKKQFYINQANAIRQRISRRREWAEEWSEKLLEMEEDVKTLEKEETHKIAELKAQLEATQTANIKMKRSIQTLETELEENVVKHQEEIEQLEALKTARIEKRNAEMAELDNRENVIRDFMKNSREYFEGLTTLRNVMIASQQKHNIEMTKLWEKRSERMNILCKEVDQQVKNFGHSYKANLKIDDPVFEENAHLQEFLAYIRLTIQQQTIKIPEIRERNITDCWKWEKEKVEKSDKKSRKTVWETSLSDRLSRGTQTEEEEIQDTVEKISELRQKAILKSIVKFVVESKALYLIPMGALPDEMILSENEQLERYETRRDFMINRRKQLLTTILDIVQQNKTILKQPEETAAEEEIEEEEDDEGEDGKSDSVTEVVSNVSDTNTTSGTLPRSASSDFNLYGNWSDFDQ